MNIYCQHCGCSHYDPIPSNCNGCGKPIANDRVDLMLRDAIEVVLNLAGRRRG